jgi:hypothetical protein
MMKSVTIASTLVLLTFFTLTASADGLIYQVPKDGTSVEYDMKLSFNNATVDGNELNVDGSLKISSVGKEIVNGQPCRWIEFEVRSNKPDREHANWTKVLVPETELAAGKAPIKHIRRAWFQLNDQAVREISDFTISDNDVGALLAFLAGPFTDNKELVAKTIESGLGKLDCKGVSGSIEFASNKRKHKYTYRNRLHEKAPFGVVSSDIKFEIMNHGRLESSGTIRITARNVKQNAVAKIPNGKSKPIRKPNKLVRILPGIGLGKVRFGMSFSEVRKKLGPPDRKTGGIYEYTSLGFAVMPGPKGRVAALMCGDGTCRTDAGFSLADVFKGVTNEGIKMGSTTEQVVEAYGVPNKKDSSKVNEVAFEEYHYTKLKMNFRFKDDRLIHLTLRAAPIR